MPFTRRLLGRTLLNTPASRQMSTAPPPGSARRLILHTPASRSAKLAASKSRTTHANNSSKFQTKKDLEKDSWPWQMAYLGYFAGVLAVPAAFCATVVEQVRSRLLAHLLAGDASITVVIRLRW